MFKYFIFKILKIKIFLKMEEVESEEYIRYNNENSSYEKNNFPKNNDFFYNDDVIPHLIKPKKEPIPKFSSMSYIISNVPKIDNNSNQVQFLSISKISLYLINKNLQKYNSTPETKNLMIIDDLIVSRETHFTSLFKDYLIGDYNEEFLRGYFNINECNDVLPKFYEYYKNYLKFFCKGTFNNFEVNDIIQEYGENQAEVYYNINYRKKDRTKKKDKKENLDEKNMEESKKSNSTKTDKISNLISLNSFFTKSVEYSIKIVKNSFENNKQEKELSNIKPINNDSKENTINLPDNSTISTGDIITKKSSIVNIIDLMKNKKRNFINKKRKNNKKMEIILIDNKKLNNNRNILSKKHFNSFSKTSSNLNDKSSSKLKDNGNKTKKFLSRNKGNNMKINNIVSKNNKILSSSNYIKYIDVLKTKKNIKIPKMKNTQNELVLSSSRIRNKKSTSNIPSFNINSNNNNLNIISNSNISNKIKGSKNKNHNLNRINLSLKIKKICQKITKRSNSSLQQLSTSKGKIHKNIIIKKQEQKEKSKSKSKKKIIKNFYFKNPISKNIKKIKGVYFSPRNNYNHNKSLSYSTLNNCNININNNFILSNNYFNSNKNIHSQQQLNNNSTKKILEKNLQKKYNVNNSKQLTSRNIRIDLDKFKTEENIVNSIILHGTGNKIFRIKNYENNKQYTSFRKSNNNEIAIKQRNLFKIKKSSINKKNLTLKDIPISNKIKSNINNNSNNTCKKIYINEEFSSINRTHKNLYIKNNNNQKNIIFDYKNK